ncbi:hypothetical protein [Bacilliculturomica massiliensis]|nr:hypothetical protein [Bacilliculturomica massiliensis]
MRNFYEYISEISREKQARLMKTWTQAPEHSYRWEDVVKEALETYEK